MGSVGGIFPPGRGFRAVVSRLACAAAGVIVLLALAGCDMSGKMFGEGVLAKVGSDELTVEDYKAAFSEIPEEFDARQEALMNLVNYKLVARQAYRDGFIAGQELTSMMYALDNELLPPILIEDIADKVVVTDDELEMHRLTDTAPVLRVSMLVAKTQEAADKAIEEIMAGRSFIEVSREDPELFHEVMKQERSIRLDDDLYPVGVRAALNSLSPGELGPVMKLEVGYGIFRLEKRIGPEEQWEAQKKAVENRIKNERAAREVRELEDRLYEEAGVTVKKVPGGFSATVDGVTITNEGAMSAEAAADPHAPHGGMNEETVLSALDRQVKSFLLAKEAKSRGLDKDPGFLRRQTLETEKAMADLYIRKMNEGVSASQQEINEYYEKNKESFASRDMVKVSRMLFGDESAAEDVLEKLKAGEDFAVLAEKYSEDDKSAAKGGDVGWVTVSRLRDPLREVLYDLDVGEFSEVMKTDYGFELLMATERKPSAVPELADIEGTIRKRVILNKRSDNIEALYSRLYNEADVKINVELLRSM